MNEEEIEFREDESDNDALTHVLLNQEHMIEQMGALKHNQHVIAENLADLLSLLRENKLVNTQILDRVQAIISNA